MTDHEAIARVEDACDCGGAAREPEEIVAVSVADLSALLDLAKQVGGLREALERSAKGWGNAIELGLLPRQHVQSAEILRDECRAALRQSKETGE